MENNDEIIIIRSKESRLREAKYCKHDFKEMGFFKSKVVCSKCDIEKEEWDKYLEEQENSNDWPGYF